MDSLSGRASRSAFDARGESWQRELRPFDGRGESTKEQEISPEQLRAICERLGGPLMYLTGRGSLAGAGITLEELGGLGYKIVADPSTPLMAAYSVWKKVYADLADGFGAKSATADWGPVEKEMLGVIGIEKLLAIEKATVERG